MSSSGPLELFGTLSNIIGTLHPAAQLLNQIYRELSKVQHNKNNCKAVCARAERIILAINNSLKGDLSTTAGIRNGQGRINQSIERLMTDLRFIHQTMRTLSEIDFFRSLLRYEYIANTIQEVNLRLSDTLACFNVAASVRDQELQKKNEQARRADTELLQKRMLSLECNDAELLRALDIKPNQILDAMLAMQKQITHVNESMERQFLQLTLNALQRQSNSCVPRTLPDWTITSYEVDIDPFNELGKGSFGVVKKGMWNQTPVAVKQMMDGTSEKLLLREIKIWWKLRHPNILPFFGASITASPPFFVSQFMENGNLVHYLRKHPAANRVQLIHEVALGLAYLHAMDVIHGDLKGSNVLISEGGKVCLADFGLSRVKHDSLVHTHTVPTQSGRGTLRFMAPEAMSEKVTQQADIYSFGMLIYETFTEEAPFCTIADAALYILVGERHKRLDHPSSLEVLQRGLTDKMWQLLWDCSSPDPSRRPRTTDISSQTEELVKAWVPSIAKGTTTWHVFDDEAFNTPSQNIQPSSLQSTRKHNSVVDHGDESMISARSNPPLFAYSERNETQSNRHYTTSNTQDTHLFTAATPTFSAHSSSSPSITLRLSENRGLPANQGFRQSRLEHPNIYTELVLDKWQKSSSTSIPCYESIQSVCVSPNNTYLAVAGFPPTWPTLDSIEQPVELPQPLHLFDLESGHRLWGSNTAVITVISFSPDSSRLICGSKGGVVVIDTKGGQEIQPILQCHEYAKVVALVGGVRVASVTSAGLLRMSDLEGHLVSEPLNVSLGLRSTTISLAAFSPDGRILVTVTSGNTLASWNSRTGEGGRIGQQPIGTEYTCLAFSLDGAFIATSIRRGESHEILIWDMSTGNKIRSLASERTVVSLAFARSSFILASCSSTGHLTFWDVENAKRTSEVVRHADEPPRRGLQIVFTPQSELSAVELLSVSPEGLVTAYKPTMKAWDPLP